MSDKEQIPTIEHAGMLEDMLHMPAYLRSDHAEGERHNGIYSCAFCGVGDSGKLLPKTADIVPEDTENQQGEGVFKTDGQTREFEASFDGSRILVKTNKPLTKPGSMLRGELQIGSSVKPIMAREIGREFCLNAGAVHNEKLTGQEGPFLTVEQGTDGPNRFYIFNGWNGFITHPPVFSAITKRKDLDAYLIEVMVSESAKVLASKLGPERILLVKPGSDPHSSPRHCP